MSFDLAAFSATSGLDLAKADEIYANICDRSPSWQEHLVADGRADAFVAELISKWPDLPTGQDDEDDEESPWAANLDCSPGHVVASIVWPMAEEVSAYFMAMAIRHGLYVYDPQVPRLYDPSSEADRDEAFGREHAELEKLECAGRRWKAKGGRALAEEVLEALVPDFINGLGFQRLARREYPLSVSFAFPISEEIEGRARLGILPRGRAFQLECAVGPRHLEVERTCESLAVADRRPFTFWQGRSTDYLDFDEFDESILADGRAKLEQLVAWARTYRTFQDVLDDVLKSSITLQKYAVVFAMGGHAERAFAIMGHEAGTEWKFRPDAGGRRTDPEKLEFIQRFNEAYDDRYKQLANSVHHALHGSGFRVKTLSDLRSVRRAGKATKGKGDPRAVAVLAEALRGASYIPLARDLAGLLGCAWGKPSAARPLAEEFRRRAAEENADDLLLGALARSFFEVADESAFDDAVRLASDPRYQEHHRCWFVWSLGSMGSETPRVLQVLIELFEDPRAVVYALQAAFSLPFNSLVNADLTEIGQAADGLATHRSQQVRNEAEHLLKRLDVAVRKQAARA